MARAFPARSQATSSAIGINDIAAFGLGAGLGLSTRIGADIYVGEALAAIACFALFPRSVGLLRRRPLFMLFVLWITWVLVQIVSDYVNNTSLNSSLRLILSIVILFPGVVGATALLVRKWTSVYWLTAGMAVAAMLLMILPSELNTINARWKWGAAGLAAYSVAGLTTWLSIRGKSVLLAGGSLVGAGAIGFFTDARSLSGLLVVVGLAYIGKSLAPRSGSNLARQAPVILIIAAGAIVLLPAVYLGYAYGASSGLFGSQARERYELQATRTNPLVVSRIELAGSMLAIHDKPVTGHGSWAEDVTYMNQVALLERQIGYDDPITIRTLVNEKGGGVLIPVHSMILGAAVWGGLGAPWLLIGILAIALWSLWATVVPSVSINIVVMWSALSLVWNLLFSPFSGGNRPALEISCAICVAWAITHVSQRKAITVGRASERNGIE